MIPSYNGADYLRVALASVLAQDRGPAPKQIEVLDDASSEDLRSVVEEIGGGRVEFFRQPKNLGLVGNMNSCIERARGEWVHILHSDDYVEPGFYDEAAALAAQSPAPEVIAIRTRFVDEQGAGSDSSPDFSGPDGRTALRRGFLDGSPVQFAGMVVRRSLYEKAGGFTAAVSHTTDVEMWSRLLCNHPAAFSPRSLGCYRLHAANDTSQLIRSGRNLLERSAVLPMLSRNAGFSPDEERAYRAALHQFAYAQCLRFAVAGERVPFEKNCQAYRATTRTLGEKLLSLRRIAAMCWRYRKNLHAS